MSHRPTEVAVHVHETTVLTEEGMSISVVTDDPVTTVLVEDTETLEVTGELAPPPEVTVEQTATEVIKVGSETIMGQGFPQQVFIGPEAPEVNYPVLWIQTFSDGTYSLWFLEV